eukprot:scaffold54906_cov69-Phaeocystis_antarctica.AAC.4
MAQRIMLGHVLAEQDGSPRRAGSPRLWHRSSGSFVSDRTAGYAIGEDCEEGQEKTASVM